MRAGICLISMMRGHLHLTTMVERMSWRHQVRCKPKRQCGDGIMRGSHISFLTQVPHPNPLNLCSQTNNNSPSRHPLGPHPEPSPPRHTRLDAHPSRNLLQHPSFTTVLSSLDRRCRRLRTPARCSSDITRREIPTHLRSLHALECPVDHSVAERSVSRARDRDGRGDAGFGC